MSALAFNRPDDEVQRLRLRVADVSARLDGIFNANLIGIAFQDESGRIVEANDCLLGLLNYSPVELRTTPLRLTDITPERFHELDRRAAEALHREGRFAPYEKRLIRNDGEVVAIMIGGALLGEGRHHSIVFVLDITERKATEEALERSEIQFRTLARNVPGVVYLCKNDERYTMLYLNEAVKELTGYPARRFLDDKLSFISLYHPDDAPNIRPKIDAALGKREQFRLCYRLRHAEGGWRWVEEFGQGVFDENGDVSYLEGTLLDITDRKLGEVALREAHAELEQRVDERTRELLSTNERLRREVLQRRRVQRRLMEERSLLLSTLEQHEAHRKLVAYEIHDGLAAYAAAALMHLQAFANHLGGADEELDSEEELRPQGRLELAIELLRNTHAEARRLITGLRPPILDESGIAAAIEFLIQEQEGCDVEIKLQENVGRERFAPLLEIAMFRAVQEALTNIVKHSGARRARIKLKKKHGRIDLRIRDWGRGFEVDRIIEQRHGLSGIRERAALLGGAAIVQSVPGKGTRIDINLPVMPVELGDTAAEDNQDHEFDEDDVSEVADTRSYSDLDSPARDAEAPSN